MTQPNSLIIWLYVGKVTYKMDCKSDLEVQYDLIDHEELT